MLLEDSGLAVEQRHRFQTLETPSVETLGDTLLADHAAMAYELEAFHLELALEPALLVVHLGH